MDVMMVDIVVPIFNELEKTKLFIDSLSRQASHRLIIVDNGSNQITQRYLQGLDAHLITNSTNLGYTKGMNQGLAQVTNQYILFTNNDVIFPTNLLQRLLVHLNFYDIIAPVTNKAIGFPANEHHPLLVDFNPDADDIEHFSEMLYVKNKSNSLAISNAYGHCLLMKREVLDKVGLLDESFTSGYHSDDDFCRRALANNMKIGLALDCFIFHFCHSTFASLGINSQREMEISKALFERKSK